MVYIKVFKTNTVKVLEYGDYGNVISYYRDCKVEVSPTNVVSVIKIATGVAKIKFINRSTTIVVE